jgi:ubiquinone/menaquinone biosynthesis C-methylase UbiE
MASPLDPQKQEQRGTYVIQDSQKELTRLKIHDHLITAAMGGVLPEQSDPTIFRRVLDIGCGPGGWLIEAAQIYPTMSLIGIDISEQMIEYARAQAKEHQLTDRIEFHVMDALLILEFPTKYFDLVNLRFGLSFLRTWDWPKMLSEMQRITRPGGVIRITDGEVVPRNTSPALTQLCEMIQCALFGAGHLFTQESRGLIDHLERLLKQYGCEQVQTKTSAAEYRAGTPEGEEYCEDMMHVFQNVHPFLQKWGCAPKDYETIYQQALDEMRQPDFLATVNLLTAWGTKGRKQRYDSWETTDHPS